MRIVMTALQPGGGIRTFFRYIYGQSAFEDCRFTLIAPDQGLSAYLEEFLPAGRIKVIEACTPANRFVGQIRKQLKAEKPDLIHSHGFSAGLLTELARTGVDVPHLMTAHDVFQSAQFTGTKGYLRKVCMAFLFRRMTGIHTVTEDARNNLLAFFPQVETDRVHGILHGVDTAYFEQGQPRPLRKEIGLPAKTPLVGFFGRFMNQKGFRLLVDAMERIVSNKLAEPVPHVITFGWGAFIREDYEYLREKGLGEYFHQAAQTNDMASAIKGVDLVVMPSRWEACGLLAMEVLAAGKPLIGSDCVGLREVIAGTPAHSIETGSSESLTSAMVEELKRLSEREKDFIAYQDEAVKRFDIGRPAHQIRGLYQNLTQDES